MDEELMNDLDRDDAIENVAIMKAELARLKREVKKSKDPEVLELIKILEFELEIATAELEGA